MAFVQPFLCASALLALNTVAAAAEEPQVPGHALGPDIAALSKPLRPSRGGHTLGPDIAALSKPLRSPRGGHALGPDVAALRTPIDCSAAANSGPACSSTPTTVAGETKPPAKLLQEKDSQTTP